MTHERLRGQVIKLGVTRRWRGINAITFSNCITDNERNRAEVRQVLDELVAEGQVEHDAASYANGAWRLRR